MPVVWTLASWLGGPDAWADAALLVPRAVDASLRIGDTPLFAKVEAVIFDCDGTLVDSEPLGFAAIVEAARELGVDFAADEDLLELKGCAMSTTLATLAGRLGRPLPADFEATVRARMAQSFRARLRLIPGAIETITGLTRPYCIASNGPRAKMDLTLEITGLMPYFEGRIYSAYEVGSFKPDPGLFLHAAGAMGVAPRHCAVVEDSAAGVAAGLAAGMTVYALRSSEPLPQALAARVHHLARLPDLCEAPWNRSTR